MTNLEQTKKDIRKLLKKARYDYRGLFYMNKKQMENKTATLKIYHDKNPKSQTYETNEQFKEYFDYTLNLLKENGYNVVIEDDPENRNFGPLLKGWIIRFVF